MDLASPCEFGAGQTPRAEPLRASPPGPGRVLAAGCRRTSRPPFRSFNPPLASGADLEVTPAVTTWPGVPRGLGRPAGQALLPCALPPVVYTGKVTGSGLVCETWLPSISQQPSFCLSFFPPFLGRPFPFGGGVRRSFSEVCTEEPHGLFPPPPEYPRMPVLGLAFGLHRVQAVPRLDILRKTYFHALCDDSSIRLCRTFPALCWQYATAHARHSENPGSWFY